MRLRDSLKPFTGGRSIAALCCLTGLLAAALAWNAGAQTAPVAAPSHTEKPVLLVVANDTWLSLTPTQKIALAPLESSWAALTAGAKQKWLTIAKTYPDLGPLEQEKLHSRMAQWAALSPKDRELARLNFAQSKVLPKSDRAANWEAYQALTPEERQKLAEGAKVKPVGAAVAIKPVAPEKLTAVPVTRHTPEQERAAAVQQRPINRNTLLPQLPQVTSSAPAAVAAPDKP